MENKTDDINQQLKPEPEPEPEPPQSLTEEEYSEASIAEQKNRIQILMEDTTICSLRQSIEDENTPTIKKIQLQTPLVDYEWEIAQKIQEIPHSALYFSTMIEPPTPIQIGSITEDNIDKCIEKQPYKKLPQETKQLVSTTYKRRQAIPLQQYLYQLKQSDSEYIFMTIPDTFLQLVYALKSLQTQENPIILFDIYPNSILYDRTPFFSDHRIAIKQQELLSKEKRHEVIPHYDDPYPTNPIEIWLLSNIVEQAEPFNAENLQQYLTTYQTKNQPIFIEEYKTYLQQFQTLDLLEEELIKTAPTWDLYSLAVIYKQLCGQLKLEELRVQINDAPKYPFLEEWYQILESIINTIPQNRPTIQEIIERIESSFKLVNTELYNSFLLELLE